MGDALRHFYWWDAQIKMLEDDAVMETCWLKNILFPFFSILLINPGIGGEVSFSLLLYFLGEFKQVT